MAISMIGAYRNIAYPYPMAMSAFSGQEFVGNEAALDVNAALPGVQKPEAAEDSKKIDLNPGESEIKAPGRKSSPAECETCKERKYQDDSDEMVSFKSAAHVSPEQAGSAVRAHENEHVANAYKKASLKGGEVVRASVSIKMAICPECGRSYVAGGETSTCIKFPKDDNPYNKNLKSLMDDATRGQNISVAV